MVLKIILAIRAAVVLIGHQGEPTSKLNTSRRVLNSLKRQKYTSFVLKF